MGDTLYPLAGVVCASAFTTAFATRLSRAAKEDKKYQAVCDLLIITFGLYFYIMLMLEDNMFL